MLNGFALSDRECCLHFCVYFLNHTHFGPKQRGAPWICHQCSVPLAFDGTIFSALVICDWYMLLLFTEQFTLTVTTLVLLNIGSIAPTDSLARRGKPLPISMLYPLSTFNTWIVSLWCVIIFLLPQSLIWLILQLMTGKTEQFCGLFLYAFHKSLHRFCWHLYNPVTTHESGHLAKDYTVCRCPACVIAIYNAVRCMKMKICCRVEVSTNVWLYELVVYRASAIE